MSVIIVRFKGGSLHGQVRKCERLPLEWHQPLMFSDGTVMRDVYEPLDTPIDSVHRAVTYHHVGLRYTSEAGPTRDDLDVLRADEFMAKFEALCDEYGARFENGSYAESNATFSFGAEWSYAYREIDG